MISEPKSIVDPEALNYKVAKALQHSLTNPVPTVVWHCTDITACKLYTRHAIIRWHK